VEALPVDEGGWLRCGDPGLMLQCVRNRASERKLRLFACACWRLVAGPVSPVVELAERLADDPGFFLLAIKQCRTKDERTLLDHAWHAARDAVTWKPEVARRAVQHMSNTKRVSREDCWNAWTGAQLTWAPMVREIFGSPFRPVAMPQGLPLSVVELASALYQGQECGFALHDALLDAGYPALAGHFQLDVWHPKGCWVVDLILSKK
jgi:hypothetical protein